jgi:membrane protease YdiL (CAAX protease family)
VVGAALYDARHTLGLNIEQVTTLTMLLSNGIIVAVVTHLLGIGYRELVHPGPASPLATFFLLVPPILLLLPLVLLLDVALIETLEFILPVSSWEQQAFSGMTALTVPTVIATCLLAPLFEEMLFRGILLRAFLERYPRGIAIGYSALYFGAAHLNVYQFSLAFFLGLLLGWLYERSRSLIPCIALHAAVNTTVVLTGSVDLATTPLLAWLVSGVAAAAGALVLRRLLARRTQSTADLA